MWEFDCNPVQVCKCHIAVKQWEQVLSEEQMCSWSVMNVCARGPDTRLKLLDFLASFANQQ